VDPLRFPEHSWEDWAFWIVSSSVSVRTSCSSVVVSVTLLINVALESGKEEVFILHRLPPLSQGFAKEM